MSAKPPCAGFRTTLSCRELTATRSSSARPGRSNSRRTWSILPKNLCLMTCSRSWTTPGLRLRPAARSSSAPSPACSSLQMKCRIVTTVSSSVSLQQFTALPPFGSSTAHSRASSPIASFCLLMAYQNVEYDDSSPSIEYHPSNFSTSPQDYPFSAERWTIRDSTGNTPMSRFNNNTLMTAQGNSPYAVFRFTGLSVRFTTTINYVRHSLRAS